MSQQQIDFTSRYDPPQYGPQTEPEDAVRYSQQEAAILELMKDGVERSTLEICAALGYAPTTRVDSRMRHLRHKPVKGAWPFTCRRCDDGVYRYRLAQRPVRVTDDMQGRTI